jgi:hypothetical protein
MMVDELVILPKGEHCSWWWLSAKGFVASLGDPTLRARRLAGPWHLFGADMQHPTCFVHRAKVVARRCLFSAP